MAVLVADIGGTNARFAITHPQGTNGVHLSNVKQYPVEQFESFEICLRKYQQACGEDFPDRAIFAVAAPTGQDGIVFTNSNWRFQCSQIKAAFAFKELQCINDFVAVAHMVANAEPLELQLIQGPKSNDGNHHVTTIIGPGTGLGVSYIIKTNGGYLLRETEASHIGFSPVDDFEEQLHRKLKDRFGRVSAERPACGAGLAEFYRLLSESKEAIPPATSDAEIWRRCLSGEDDIATDALHRYCGCLGSIAGDLVLAQGASRLVMVGSLAGRLVDIIPNTNFYTRFHAKGRFSALLEKIAIEFVDSDNPGLKGAALTTLATNTYS